MSGRPLEALSREYDTNVMGHGDGWGKGSWGTVLLWFIIVAVIVWFVLYSVKPTFVQKKDDAGETTGEVDNGKALLWSVIIALIVAAIVWLFGWSEMGY